MTSYPTKILTLPVVKFNNQLIIDGRSLPKVLAAWKSLDAGFLQRDSQAGALIVKLYCTKGLMAHRRTG